MKKTFLAILLIGTLSITSCGGSTKGKKPDDSKIGKNSMTQGEKKADEIVLDKDKYENKNHEINKEKQNNKIDSSKNDKKVTQDEIDIRKLYKDGVYYENKAVVLTYHHISSKPFSGITIKPERFESDLKVLKKNGFNVISLRQLLNAMEGTEKLPKNAVVITFDDGIESFYKYAFPILKKYNMVATNFVITSRVESYKTSSDDFNSLSKNEIKEMYDSGIIDIQSHSHNGHDYVKIGPQNKTGGKLAYKIYNPGNNTYETDDSFFKRVNEDLNVSRNLIYEYTGNYPDMICFPFGYYNKRLVDIAKQNGYKYFITTGYGYNKYSSKSKYVMRIRSGDSNLTSEKLFKNIVYCANDIK